MDWRYLIFLPLAALCVGDPAPAPKLRLPIPETIASGCPYADARKQFLLAYAYWKDKPEVARYFCANANKLIGACGPEADLLRVRIAELCDIPLAQ